jgi:predicted small lipoprotein YifL
MKTTYSNLALLGLTASLAACGYQDPLNADVDEDEITIVDDCNDEDASLNSVNSDNDCDGLKAAADCDDQDPESNSVAEDGDCDGIITESDCNDSDPESTVVSEDADCDGILTTEDCNDSDPDSTQISDDNDCDGTLTADDCDDNDPESTAVADDLDCDDTLTADDCDDNDPESTVIADDGDCDSVLTEDDCDDADPESNVVAEDTDCDGTRNAIDCDDEDPSLNQLDVDEDGYSTCEDDCDDEDPSYHPDAMDTATEDLNCNGIQAEELAHHDSSFEESLGCESPQTCSLGVRFTPSSYPVNLNSISFDVWGSEASNVTMLMYRDIDGSGNGPEGLPNFELMTEIDLTSFGKKGPETVEFDLRSEGVTITAGDVYIVLLDNDSGWMGLAVDLDSAVEDDEAENWILLQPPGPTTASWSTFAQTQRYLGNWGVSILVE